DSQTESLKRRIQITGVDAVAIVNHEPVALFSRDALSELLERPFRRRMKRYIAMPDPPGPDLHDNEYKDESECRRHDHEEVCGNICFGMIAHKSHPPLRR